MQRTIGTTACRSCLVVFVALSGALAHLPAATSRPARSEPNAQVAARPVQSTALARIEAWRQVQLLELAFDRALHGGGLLSEPARRLMMTPNLNGYGYGLSIKPPDEHVSGRTSIGHTGGLGDRSAVLRRFADDEVTLIVLANVPRAAIDAATELERLYFNVVSR